MTNFYYTIDKLKFIWYYIEVVRNAGMAELADAPVLEAGV